ncbi:BgTH12-07753 [Blumeria graminis f. sp. triticale]|uniref:BgTH12-07753 n=1 Tax=Blumeria graminis f. sp. triticale TaxID=1689686 RepID=A0A9W4GIQ8_BLUGR|nr:BgTH12-07753 [Blumeria graminis f. sp. triticale]
MGRGIDATHLYVSLAKKSSHKLLGALDSITDCTRRKIELSHHGTTLNPPTACKIQMFLFKTSGDGFRGNQSAESPGAWERLEPLPKVLSQDYKETADTVEEPLHEVCNLTRCFIPYASSHSLGGPCDRGLHARSGYCEYGWKSSALTATLVQAENRRGGARQAPRLHVLPLLFHYPETNPSQVKRSQWL